MKPSNFSETYLPFQKIEIQGVRSTLKEESLL